MKKEYDYSSYDPIDGWKARAPFARFFEFKVIECPSCKTGTLIMENGYCGTCAALIRKQVSL